jgi:hypothetical protein
VLTNNNYSLSVSVIQRDDMRKKGKRKHRCTCLKKVCSYLYNNTCSLTTIILLLLNKNKRMELGRNGKRHNTYGCTSLKATVVFRRSQARYCDDGFDCMDDACKAVTGRICIGANKQIMR